MTACPHCGCDTPVADLADCTQGHPCCQGCLHNGLCDLHHDIEHERNDDDRRAA